MNNIAGRVTSIIMNVVLLAIAGRTLCPSTAFDDHGRLSILCVYGMCDSLQPAVGFNWGARNIKRVKAIVNGTPKRVYACTRCLRSGKVTRAV